MTSASMSLFRPVMSWIRSSHSLASQKIHRARVNTLLFGADRLLLTPRADNLESYLMTKLSKDTFHNSYRPTAFIRLLRFSLQRHLFDLALALYQRMRYEGFLATHALSLRMTALQVARQATHLKDLSVPLKKLFENEAYDVPAFMDLVRYLVDDKQAQGALIDDLARTFISARRINLCEHPDLVGELARVNMRAGRLDAAQTWLRAFEDACNAQGVLPDVAPYSDIITTLRDIHPKNGQALQDVLHRMKSAGVSPDTSVFNALIRANFVQQRYHEACALYHVLMEKRSTELMPNDVTYKMLFRATLLLNNSRVARRHKPPENLVPPRTLFREMLACHLDQTHGRSSSASTVISVSAFHLALRTFMAREDYAAAFVVVNAMHAFGFQPTLQTYLIVFVSLLHRLKRDANLPRPENSCRLVDFLTHLRPNEDPDVRTLLDRIQQQHDPNSLSPLGIETVSHLLDLGEPDRPAYDDLPNVPSLPRFPSNTRRRRAQTPTVDMLKCVEGLAVSPRTFFSPVPLARIIHKMLLGELFRKAVHRDAGWDWRGAAVAILEETGREMVPEGVGGGEETLGKQARGRGREEGVLPFAAARMRRRRQGARGGREIAFSFEG